VYGNYLAQVKGYDFNFQANAKDLARRALDSE